MAMSSHAMIAFGSAMLIPFTALNADSISIPIAP